MTHGAAEKGDGDAQLLDVARDFLAFGPQLITAQSAASLERARHSAAPEDTCDVTRLGGASFRFVRPFGMTCIELSWRGTPPLRRIHITQRKDIYFQSAASQQTLCQLPVAVALGSGLCCVVLY